MKSFLANCILFLLLSFAICSCTLSFQQDNGLNIQVPDLPKIAEFSGSEYENFSMQYPPVESAILRCGSKETAISPDDPRLIRLLNFLLYSESEGLTGIRQGLVSAEEIDIILQSDIPMLDITFVHEYVPNHIRTSAFLPRMIICGDSYLTFMYGIEELEGSAEHFLPYYSLLVSLKESGEVSSDISTSTDWYSKNWIELLKYAGF